jgi:hypothetical protein
MEETHSRQPDESSHGSGIGAAGGGNMRSSKSAFHWLFALALAAPALCPAATWVVDQRHRRASDANPGTEKAPFKTITAAIKVVKPGDAIAVKNGTYRESVTLPAGTNGLPITLTAWKGHHPVVKGSEVVKGPWRPAHINIRYRPGQATGPISGRAVDMVKNFAEYMNRKEAAPSPGAETNAWAGEQPGVPWVGIYVCKFEPHTQMVFVDEQPLKQIGPCEYIGPKDPCPWCRSRAARRTICAPARFCTTARQKTSMSGCPTPAIRPGTQWRRQSDTRR